MSVGYPHLVDMLGLRIASPVEPCTIDARVHALVRTDQGLRVPITMAIADDDLLGHLVFALKHQGVQLELIQAAAKRIDPQRIQAALDTNPNGKYLRQTGFLVEAFTSCKFSVKPSVTAYTPLFDPKRYITGPSRRNAKYRVDQNGLGDLQFCPTVRRTAALAKLLERDLFADLAKFVQHVGGSRNLDRTLGWAYLSETRSSFDIEGEAPSEDRARRFVQLLHTAHDAQDLTEEHLSALQSGIVANPLFHDLHFRTRQNWLQRGARQARTSDVSFIPPAPNQLGSLMRGLMRYANARYPTNNLEALIKSLLVSFGFVFNHPFLDGNGRLSRFLIHHGLCRAALLEQGLLLPISVAFNHHEDGYLRALESVSSPIRALWRVDHLSPDTIDANLDADADPYRYWDGTAIAEFGLRMAHYALDHTLVDEIAFIERFDRVYARINREYDLISKDLVNLIRMAASEGGRLSKRRRKQYALRVPAETLDAIETAVCDEFGYNVNVPEGHCK